jgi:hypothetical protein
MVVVGIFVADADNAEPLRVQRACSFALTPVELHIDVLP